MTSPTTPEGHQPRERMVPCWRCGVDPRTGKPRTMTGNWNRDCGNHATIPAQQDRRFLEEH